MCGAEIIDNVDLERLIQRSESKGFKLANRVINLPIKREIEMRQRIKTGVENLDAENYV